MLDPTPTATHLADAFAAIDAAHPSAPTDRHEERAALERDAAALPTTGPLADLVRDLAAEMREHIALESTSAEAGPRLRPFGARAYDLTGSIRGMRAVCQKASEADPRHAALCRDLIDKAWNGIGGAGGVWTS